MFQRHMSALIVALVVLGGSAAAHAACESLPAPVPAYNITVRNRILPLEEKLLSGVIHRGRKFALGGVPVFSGSDKFLPGKIALALADHLVSLPAEDPRLASDLAAFREVTRVTLRDPNDTWGIYYYLLGLNNLKVAGLLGRAVDPHSLTRLRAMLDWRTFVNPATYRVIDLPNNYYVVALGIARLRHALGWRDRRPPPGCMLEWRTTTGDIPADLALRTRRTVRGDSIVTAFFLRPSLPITIWKPAEHHQPRCSSGCAAPPM